MIGQVIRHRPQGGTQTGRYGAGTVALSQSLKGNLAPVAVGTVLHLRIRADSFGADYFAESYGPDYHAESWEGD